jgi:excinuclease ABC subunit A
MVVAEHDIPVAASADWVIDLGPGAGPDGGVVVAAGSPEEVAGADTPTAGFFRRYAAGLPLLGDPATVEEAFNARSSERS